MIELFVKNKQHSGSNIHMDTFTIVAIIILNIFAVISISLNAVSFWSILKSKSLSKRPSLYLIVNLLSVHFVQGLITIPLYAGKKANVSHLRLNTFFCDGSRFTSVLTFYGAVYGVLFVAIDRLLATLIVMKYKVCITKTKVCSVLSLYWVYLLLFSLIPFFNTNNISAEITNSTSSFYKKESTCSYRISTLWSTLMLTINCGLPYIAIILIYKILIGRIKTIEVQSRINSKGLNKGLKFAVTRQLSILNKHLQRRIIKLGITLTIAYTILWSPTIIYYTLINICPKKCFKHEYVISKEKEYIEFFLKCLTFLDALVAPILYCLCTAEFRNSFIRIFMKRNTKVSIGTIE